MRRLFAGLITAALLGLMLWSSLRRPATPSAETADQVEEPESEPAVDPLDGAGRAVRDLLAAAREGDVNAYLDGFGPPLRGRLDREAAEAGAERFGADLRAAADARRSHAVFAPVADGPDRARVTVEAVYPDRNERQTFVLDREPDAGRWLVTVVETVKAHQPTTRYGTPVSFIPPEAPPDAPAPPAE